jgi:hypothetical protein
MIESGVHQLVRAAFFCARPDAPGRRARED